MRTELLLNDDAVQLIDHINKPVAVLSIAGPYRTGKSYILSRLLGSCDAFELGDTVNAQTFGIWMGTTVLECDDHVIVLLDTEGIEAIDAEATDDARILVLALLLSSYFIYNTRSPITGNDLSNMR